MNSDTSVAEQPKRCSFDGVVEIHTHPGDFETQNCFKFIPGCCSSTGASMFIAVFTESDGGPKEWLVVGGNYAGSPSGGVYHEVIMPLCDVSKIVHLEQEEIALSELPRHELIGHTSQDLFASRLLYS